MKDAPRSLKDQQQRFRELVVREDRADLNERTWLNDSSAFPLPERVGVYQYAYWARLIESLEDDFPRTKKLLGKSAFLSLARFYLTRHPSRFASVAEISDGFAAFVRAHADESIADVASELARFEWVECLVSLEEVPASNLGQMAALKEEQVQKIVMLLNPSLQVFESIYSVHRLKKPVRKASRGYRTLLFRAGGRVRQLSLSRKAFAVLESLRGGTKLGDLQAFCAELGVSESQASQWFSTWASEGLIHDFHQEKET